MANFARLSLLVAAALLPCAASADEPIGGIMMPPLSFEPTTLTSTYGCDHKGAFHIIIDSPKNGDPLMWLERPVTHIDICVPPGTTVTQGTPTP